jgi:tetratricopeptide (TPR) repeat protein
MWMHNLIQFMMEEGTRKEETHREWLQSSVSLVCGAFRHVQYPELLQRWAGCENFMPHLRSLVRRWNAIHDTNLELVEAMVAMDRYLWRQGRYGEAEVVCKDVLECYETKFGWEHSNTHRSMNNLASVYQMQRRYDEAEVLLKQMLVVTEEHLGAEHLCRMNNLVLVYDSQGRYSESEMLLKRVLAVREKNLGAEHPDTLLSLNNFGTVTRITPTLTTTESDLELPDLTNFITRTKEHPSARGGLADVWEAALGNVKVAVKVLRSQFEDREARQKLTMVIFAGVFDSFSTLMGYHPLSDCVESFNCGAN